MTKAELRISLDELERKAAEYAEVELGSIPPTEITYSIIDGKNALKEAFRASFIQFMITKFEITPSHEAASSRAREFRHS
jgi:hypothetical protein